MPGSKEISSISFAEIVSERNAFVRVTEDHLLYAVDLAMLGTGKSRDYTAQVIRNIKNDVFPSSKFIERQLHAGHPTKLLNVDDAIQFLMILPGQTAMEMRIKFAVIIRKHLAGDQTLHAEINANAVSDSPIAQLARASIESPATVELQKDAHAKASPEMDVVVRKRQMERDDALFEMELAERKQQLLQLTMTTQKTLMDTYRSLCPNMVIDDRARLMFKDNLLNIASQSTSSSITSVSSHMAIGNGIPAVTNASPKPLTISTVAAEMGLNLDNKQLKEVGRRMARWYRVEYGEEPGTHEQFVEGAVRFVKSYTDRDRGKLESVIKQVMDEK